MRLHRRWGPAVACLVALVAAGCGASGPTPKPTVSVSITAPTSGATVGVHRVVVAGTVTPVTAHVVIAGQPAQVAGGKFTRALWLSTPTQVVSVTAQAQGYTPAHTATTINYSPNLAAQLVASASALAPPRATASPAPAVTASAAAISALNQAVALPKSATSASANGAAASPTKATPTPTSPAHTTPTPTAPTHTAPAPAAPTPTTPTTTTPIRPPASSAPPTSTGGGAGPPASPPVTTVARIKQSWATGCLQHAKGQNVAPYCRCVYNHLSATGTFKTTKTVNALLKKLHAYSNSGDLQSLPRAIRTALTVCSPKLPVLNPMTGQPPLTPLAGLHHKRMPFPAIARLHAKSH